jgi:hypothetical protein
MGTEVAVGPAPAPVRNDCLRALGESTWMVPAPSEPQPLDTAAPASRTTNSKDRSKNLGLPVVIMVHRLR